MEYDVQKISTGIKYKKIRKNTINGLIFTIVILLFIINVIGLYKNSVEEDDVADVFGLYFFNIISGSMEPEIHEGDLVIVKKTPWNELKENDVITFKNEENIISHRIKKIITGNNDTSYKTKGDNNEVEDNFEVLPSQIYGKVVFNINNLGSLVNYIHTIKGLTNLVIIICLIYIITIINERKKNKRKDKRRKYEIKKIREKYEV